MVANQSISKIGPGLLVFVAFSRADQRLLDEPAPIQRFAERIVKLRIFEDQAGKMNLSLQDIGGQVLLVSEFTLYAELAGGHRPSFTEALTKSEAEKLYQALASSLQAYNVVVATGQFGAKMLVRLINDGPVTIILGD